MKKTNKLAALISAMCLALTAAPSVSLAAEDAEDIPDYGILEYEMDYDSAEDAELYAATIAWPSLASSSYCEFKAPEQISVYKDAALKTRGTSNPAKAYNAYISKNDICYIYKITTSYIQVNYPTSSGRHTGYIKRSALLSVSSPKEKVTSKGKATTYVSSGGSSYGYTEKGDTVYACGTSSSYTAILYTAKSGKRSYKYGWVKTSDYKSIIKGSSSQKTDYSKKKDEFLADSRWKVGTSWGSRQNPKLSTHSATGCCAYAWDFAEYVYGKGVTSGTKFSKASEIKTGDIIYVTPTHWMIVLSRSGDNLEIVHGNWTGGKVCKGTYNLNGQKIGNSGKTFDYGYHFQ